jgi:hypothetical protein
VTNDTIGVVSSHTRYSGVRVSGRLPPAIVRTQRQVESVFAQSLTEMGPRGRTTQAWNWAITGAVQTPVTLAPGTGEPPTMEAVIAEADGDVVYAAGPVPNDVEAQVSQARKVLRWLVGVTDELPVCNDPGNYS